MPSFVCCFGHPSPWSPMTSTSCLFWHGRRRDTGFSMICMPLVTFQGKAGHWETSQLETWLVRWLLLPFTHWNASLRYPWKIPEQNSHVLVCHSPLLDHQTRELRPSHWIEWSLERLTSHSIRSNSCCSPPQSQKHTVRRQKRSHMLEEMMEPERPLVWSCPFIDLNGNILYWEARNVSLVHVKFAADLQEKKPTHATNQEAEGEAMVDLQHTELYSYAQHKMILWHFSHIVQTVLVMVKWIIADCMTSSWLWVNLSSPQCKCESECMCRTLRHADELSSVGAAQESHSAKIDWSFAWSPWPLCFFPMRGNNSQNDSKCQTLPRTSEMVMVFLARLFQVPSSTASEPWTYSTLSGSRPWSLFKNPKVQLSRV